MNILFCGDKNIQNGLMITILSLLENTDEKLDIYVLTLNMTMNNTVYQPVEQKFIEFMNCRLSEQFNNRLNITEIDVSDLFKKNIPSANLGTRFTPCCMLRLFADEIDGLPDKLLYLDTDIICRLGFSDFYNQDMSGLEIAGVLDYYGSWFFRKNILKRDYLNSGVLLMNLKELRKTKLLKKCRQMCTDRKMFMPDQSALNKLSVNKKICDRRFNDQRRLHKDTVFQHFTTTFRFFPYVRTVTVKPWQIDKMHDVLELHEYDDLLSRYLDLRREYDEKYA